MDDISFASVYKKNGIKYIGHSMNISSVRNCTKSKSAVADSGYLKRGLKCTKGGFDCLILHNIS